jgi:hypothetical protein
MTRATIQVLLPEFRLEQQVFMGFPKDSLHRPIPTAARQVANQTRRHPAEELGLYVAPTPKLNSASLHKMEQRLALARRLDVAALVAQLQQQFPTAMQPGQLLVN